MFAFPDPPRYRMAASLSCYLKDDRVILVFPALTLEGRNSVERHQTTQG